MCIAFWTLDHQDYALILCTNRDEFLHRPTADATWHSSSSDSVSHSQSTDSPPTRGKPAEILSGVDVQAGGTWFGVGRDGRIGLLTNITEYITTKFSSSRGHLVSSYLAEAPATSLEDYTLSLEKEDIRFAGFNLLLLSPRCHLSSRSPSHPPNPEGAASDDPLGPIGSTAPLTFDARLVSNGGAGNPISSRALTPEERNCGGVSNGLDERFPVESDREWVEWEKVKQGKGSFRRLLDSFEANEADGEGKSTEESLVEGLFRLLEWKSSEPVTQRSDLRKTIHIEPLQLPSPTGVQYYATRLSTVLLVRRDGQALFVERDIWQLDGRPGGFPVKKGKEGQRVFRFDIGGNGV